jgi:hypothetical protein
MPRTPHAIVIPIYQKALSQNDLFSIKNAVSVLSRHDVYFVGPTHLIGFLHALTAQFERPVRVQTFADRFFGSIDGYNRLMLSSLFYEAFQDYQYILISQTDSLVFRDELDIWAKKSYSYIGAPWFEGFTQPTMPLQLTSVGNGGFSLRNVQDFLRVLNQPRIFKNVLMDSWPGNILSTCYRYIKDYRSFLYKNTQINLNVNEDLFWGLFVPPNCAFFNVPSPREAVAFAFEAHPEYSYALNNNQLPFGCHAWARYNPAFWSRTFEQHHLLNPL